MVAFYYLLMECENVVLSLLSVHLATFLVWVHLKFYIYVLEERTRDYVFPCPTSWILLVPSQ